MKLIYAVTFVAMTLASAIYAYPGDTYNCNGGHWVIISEVAKCVAGNSTVPPGSIPPPTPLYTAVPLYPDCKPLEHQTPTSEYHQINLPIVAGGSNE